MKKGFTMIELIFVIVILGILASVAIPRLAGTKADAEISAAVANLRTLVSDASAYYTLKGTFGTDTKWNEITNVPLDGAGDNAVSTTATAKLKVGGADCIGLYLVNKNGNIPAHIKFTTPTNTDSVCTQVKDAAPVKAYIADSKVTHPNSAGGVSKIDNAIAVGSTTSVYK